MNLGSRSIVIPELLHFQHVQVLKERYVDFPEFLSAGIELCSLCYLFQHLVFSE